MRDGGVEKRVERGSALDRVARQATPWLRRFLQRHTGSRPDAEDLAQEALLRLVRSDGGERLHNPDAFLQTIAGNLLRDHGRRGHTRAALRHLPLSAANDVPSAEPDAYRHAAARERLARAQAAVDRLRPRTREIFLLNRLDGLTYGEIAAREQLSVSAVEKHMMKAILQLDRAMGR